MQVSICIQFLFKHTMDNPRSVNQKELHAMSKGYMLKKWNTGSSFADETHALLTMGRQSIFLDLSFLAAFSQERASLLWAFWYLVRIAAMAIPNLMAATGMGRIQKGYYHWRNLYSLFHQSKSLYSFIKTKEEHIQTYFRRTFWGNFDFVLSHFLL